MVYRDPVFALPAAEDGDVVKTYPTISRELVDKLAALFAPVVVTNGFTTTGSGSGISSHNSRIVVVKPSTCLVSISWTQGSTIISSGSQNFWAGTISDTRLRPGRISMGAFRANTGGGVCQVSTNGDLHIKFASSDVIAASTVYCTLAYELAAPMPLIGDLPALPPDLAG